MNAVVAVPDDVSQRGGGLGCALFLRRNPKSCTARRCSSNCGATIRGGQLRAVGRVNSVSSVGEFRVFNSLELRQRELKAAIGDKRWCFGADENDPGLRKCRRSGLLQNPVATGVAPRLLIRDGQMWLTGWAAQDARTTSHVECKAKQPHVDNVTKTTLTQSSFPS